MTADDLALTSDERDLRSALRSVLAEGFTPAARLACLRTTDPGYSPQLWSVLTGELGLAGLTVPGEFGGLGLGPAATAIVHEELGYVLYPGPLLSTHLAAAAILATADPLAQRRWLPPIAEGALRGALAAASRSGSWEAGGEDVRARRDRGGWRLTGTRWYVIAGHAADVIVVPAVTGQGLSAFLVEQGADGLWAQTVPGLDLTRRLAVIQLDAAPAVLLGREGSGQEIIGAAHHALLLSSAAEAAGGMSWCLETCVEYAASLGQAGHPADADEAAARACVDMLARQQASSAVVRYAAIASAQAAADAPVAVRMAALRAGEAYRGVTESAVHLLGSDGFTRAHDAHLYYRRAWSVQQLTGTPRAHRAALADLQCL